MLRRPTHTHTHTSPARAPGIQVAGTAATNPDGAGVLCIGDVVGQTQYIFHIIALALREVRW